jgi:hypothetical protein
MSFDLKAQQIRVNKIINSGSNSAAPLLIYGLSAATNEEGGVSSANFITGTDTWLYISGVAGSKNSSSRGSVTLGGDITVSGTIYDSSGVAYSTAGATPGGSNTHVQFNDSGIFSGSSGLTFNKSTGLVTITGSLNVGGNVSVTGGQLNTTATNGFIFSSNVAQLKIGDEAANIIIGGNVSTGSSFTFSVATHRTGSSTINLGTAANIASSTKTINLGTGGIASSNTIINLGTVSSAGTTTINLSGSLYVTGSTVTKGTILPSDDLTYTLGSETKRWAHIYTGDLHLRNDRGDWTIIEEPDFLRLRNNKTGKNYELLMKVID